MKLKWWFIGSLALGLVLVVGLAGCEQKAAPSPTAKAAATTAPAAAPTKPAAEATKPAAAPTTAAPAPTKPAAEPTKPAPAAEPTKPAAPTAATATAAPTSKPVAGTPPKTPHDTAGRDDCLMCHGTGVGGAKKVPADHAGRTSQMCLGCHVKA